MIHTVEVLDRSGHLSLTWDPEIPESVERARGDFETLRQAGYSFFRVVDQTEAERFAGSEGALLVKRVDADEVAPVAEPVEKVRAAQRRGRGHPQKPAGAAPGERVVAVRPMRGG